MTGQMNVRVRVVKCPRCSELLPEMAEVPVYKCGGCGVVLKAKIRKNESKDTELQSSDPTEGNGSRDQGTGGLNQQTTVPSPSKSDADKSNKDRGSDFLDHNVEKINGFHHSDELHSTSDQENPGLSKEARPNIGANETNRVDQNERRDEDDFGEKNFSRHTSPSTGPSNDSSSSEAGKASQSAEPGEVSPSAETRKASPLTELSEASLSTEVGEAEPSTKPGEAELGEDSSSSDTGGADEPLIDSMHRQTESLFPSAGACIEVKASKSLEQNDEWDQSEFEEEDSEPDQNLKKHPISDSSSEQSLLGSGQMHSFDTARRSFTGSILTCDLGSPLKEQIYQGQNSDYQGHGHLSLTDTREASPSTESICYQKGSSSPLAVVNFEANRRKSFEQNNEGDQSESAEVDTEAEENLKRHPISKSSSEDSLLGSSTLHSFATARRSFADSILTMSPPMEQIYQGQNSLFRAHGRESSTDTLENFPRLITGMEPNSMLNNISKSPTTKSYNAYYGSESSCNENEYRAHGRHFHGPKRNLKDKGLVSPKGLAQREEITTNHHPVKGNRWHQDEFVKPTREVPRVPLYPRGSQAGPSTYGHNKIDHSSMYEHKRPDTSKIELLKMVYELQDQLDRKYGSVESANRKLGQGRNWQPSLTNRVAFSGEAGQFRHQVDCSCLRCLPQERHYSAQLPHRMVHQSSNCYNSPYRSNSPSPVRFTGSEISSWSHDNDQWQKEREIKKSTSSQKYQPVKRHIRPVAGGSPIIACYKCSAVLQLPADFFVFRRKFHVVRCSECSMVLKFSVQDRVHLVRYLPDPAVAPPPSEVDEYNNTDSTFKRRNLALALASASRVSEPISSSVDYGRSSTEGDNSSPFVPSFRTRVNSFEPVEERNNKSVFKGLKKETKNQKSGSRKNVSPLHRLMGYASPSKVWKVDFNGV